VNVHHKVELSSVYATKLLTDIDIDPATKKVKSCHLYVGTNEGVVVFYNLKQIFSQSFSTLNFTLHSNTRLNYNPYRTLKENFI
jgi:hypothetical protein